MDSLIYQLQSCTFDSDNRFYIHNGSLFTKEYIPEGTCLGEVNGDRIYVWEIPYDEIDKNDYMTLTDDCAFSFKNTMRTSLTYMRYYTEAITPICQPNCCFIFSYSDEMPKVFIYTIKDVQVNEELLYDITPSF